MVYNNEKFSLKTKTELLAKALGILSIDIQSDDGIANAVIAEAATRLIELESKLSAISMSAREECAAILNLTRSEAQLMAGEMTNGEWRTVSAILLALQAKIRKDQPALKRQSKLNRKST